MMDGLREMWEALRAALARQALETPDFLAPWLTKAARLALIAAVLFAALAAASAAWALVRAVRAGRQTGRRALRRAAAWGGVLALALCVCAWAFWPAPMTKGMGAVTAVEVRTRVPGKAEKTLTLTKAQQQEFLDAVSAGRRRRGWADELPYAGYGQTFRIFLTAQSEAGEEQTVCIYMAPGEGCVYTDTDEALIYPVCGYEAFYERVRALAAKAAPSLVDAA